MCRQRVELQIAFDACMKYRRSILPDSETLEVNLYTHLGDLTKESLFRLDEIRYNCLESIQRECLHCGVDKIRLLPVETSDEGEVVWKRNEYMGTGKMGPNGKEQKKIALAVKKRCQRKGLFNYLVPLLGPYPYHSFLAKGQKEQFDNHIEHLPANHAVCVPDYSKKMWVFSCW